MQSTVDKQPGTVPAALVEERRGNNAEEQKFAMARTCKKKRFSPECEVHLQHCFVALQADEDRAIASGERPRLRRAAPSAPRVAPTAADKRQRVIVAALFREVQRNPCAHLTLPREGWCYCLLVSGTSLRGCQASHSALTVTHCTSYPLLLAPVRPRRLLLAVSAGVADSESVCKDLWTASSLFISPACQREGV